MDEYTKKQIKRKVYEKNITNQFKEHIKDLVNIGNDYTDKKILNKDGSLTKKLYDELKTALNEKLESFCCPTFRIEDSEPLFHPACARINAYVCNSEYNIRIDIILNYKIGEKLRNGQYDYDDNVYFEDTLYLFELDFKEDVTDKWKEPRTNKILKMYSPNEFEQYNVNECLKQFEKVESAKIAYEEEKKKLPFYSLRSMI